MRYLPHESMDNAFGRTTFVTSYQLIPGPETETQMLCALATEAYESAAPRRMGHNQPFLHDVDQAPDFRMMADMTVNGTLTSDLDSFPNRMLRIDDAQGIVGLTLDYINGRDCRFNVSRHGASWLFSAYAFEQRGVESYEFMAGVVRNPADQFLERVAERLRKDPEMYTQIIGTRVPARDPLAEAIKAIRRKKDSGPNLTVITGGKDGD